MSAVVEMRQFPVNVVLCVVCKSVPDPALMPEIYKLLEFLTGGSVSTTQLASAMNESHSFLVHRNPQLALGWDRVARDADSLRAWFDIKRNQVGVGLPLVRN